MSEGKICNINNNKNNKMLIVQVRKVRSTNTDDKRRNVITKSAIFIVANMIKGTEEIA